MRIICSIRNFRYLILLLSAVFLVACSDESPFITTTDGDPVTDPVTSIVRIGSTVAGTFIDGTLLTSPDTITATDTSSVTAELVDATAVAVTSSTTVTFTSTCAAMNPAMASFDTPAVTTTTGTARTTYTTQGCTGSDLITATINGSTSSATGTITITTPTPGSIIHSGTTNSTIALSGTGSASGLPETTIITFTIKDANDNPVQNENVIFTLNSTLGGITLSTTTATSDINGEVATTVQSGTVATNIRVTATVTVDNNTVLTTASSAIAIATGPPDQNSMSLSAETLNPRAWNLDGREVKITALLADRYNNKIADGSSISFTTEFGAIDPSCITSGGGCTVIWRSQNPRTNSFGGRPGVTTIMATVEGEESFIDVDADGVFSDGVLPNGDPYTDLFTDLAEAFRDDNNNLTYDTGEVFVDFNIDGIHNPGNNLYNGKGCTHSSECDHVTDAITVRDSIELVLAEDSPLISRVQFNNTGAVAYPVGTPTFNTQDDSSISFTIGGVTNAQVLPIGSTINFAVSNSEIVAGSNHTVANSNSAAQIYTVFISPDDTPSNDGFLTIAITVGDGGLLHTFTPIAINDIGQTYSIGGIVSGLPAGETVTLRNNGGNNLVVTANGNFTFTQQLANEAAYEVTVGLDPATATCTVALGSGTVSAADVADVVVTCQ